MALKKKKDNDKLEKKPKVRALGDDDLGEISGGNDVTKERWLELQAKINGMTGKDVEGLGPDAY